MEQEERGKCENNSWKVYSGHIPCPGGTAGNAGSGQCYEDVVVDVSSQNVKTATVKLTSSIDCTVDDEFWMLSDFRVRLEQQRPPQKVTKAPPAVPVTLTATTCGKKVGNRGPSQSDCDQAYGSAKVTVEGTGYQIWDVAESGMYQITAYGAKGGDHGSNHADSRDRGGKGAEASGKFQLQKGDQLVMVVGQEGWSNPECGDWGAGGGGGTFVAKVSSDGEEITSISKSVVLLLVAGGGAGPSDHDSAGSEGCHQRVAKGGRATEGTPDSRSEGGSSVGGAGYKHPGSEDKAHAFLVDALGATHDDKYGGYGGGGTPYNGGGGGGGYDGGDCNIGGSDDDCYGGSSFPSSAHLTANVNDGPGKVVITKTAANQTPQAITGQLSTATVRLVDEDGNACAGNNCLGMVQVHKGGRWGYVCNDVSTHFSGKVVCRQMGFSGVAHDTGNNYNGRDDTISPAAWRRYGNTFQLDDIHCNGTESRWEQCPHRDSGHDCHRTEGWNLQCSGGSSLDGWASVTNHTCMSARAQDTRAGHKLGRFTLKHNARAIKLVYRSGSMNCHTGHCCGCGDTHWGAWSGGMFVWITRNDGVTRVAPMTSGGNNWPIGGDGTTCQGPCNTNAPYLIFNTPLLAGPYQVRYGESMPPYTNGDDNGGPGTCMDVYALAEDKSGNSPQWRTTATVPQLPVGKRSDIAWDRRYYYDSTAATWTAAQRQCAQKGWELAVVNSYTEAEALYQAIGVQTCWIGMTTGWHGRTSEWANHDKVQNPAKWILLNSKQSQTVFGSVNDRCVRRRNDPYGETWERSPCGQSRPVCCSQTKKAFRYIKGSMGRQEALKKCQALGKGWSLASVRSATEMNILRSVQRDRCWIGLQRNKGYEAWTWSDKSSFSKDGWMPRFTIGQGPKPDQQRCVSQTFSGHWEDSESQKAGCQTRTNACCSYTTKATKKNSPKKIPLPVCNSMLACMTKATNKCFGQNIAGYHCVGTTNRMGATTCKTALTIYSCDTYLMKQGCVRACCLRKKAATESHCKNNNCGKTALGRCAKGKCQTQTSAFLSQCFYSAKCHASVGSIMATTTKAALRKKVLPFCTARKPPRVHAKHVANTKCGNEMGTWCDTLKLTYNCDQTLMEHGCRKECNLCGHAAAGPSS